MRGRKHVQLIRRNKSGGFGSASSNDPRAAAADRINGLDQAWLSDRDVDELACRIEERRVGDPCQRPFTSYVAGEAIQFYKRATIARHVQKVLIMINVDPMCSM